MCGEDGFLTSNFLFFWGSLWVGNSIGPTKRSKSLIGLYFEGQPNSG